MSSNGAGDGAGAGLGPAEKEGAALLSPVPTGAAKRKQLQLQEQPVQSLDGDHAVAADDPMDGQQPRAKMRLAPPSSGDSEQQRRVNALIHSVHDVAPMEGLPIAANAQVVERALPASALRESAAAASAPSNGADLAACPMLRVLQRDCHAQFRITDWLDVEELAAMHACCRTWRYWIQHPPASVLDSIHRRRLIQADALQQLSMCSWARLYFTGITIDIDDDERIAGPLTAWLNLKNRALFARICFSISRFPRLRTLRVAVCYVQIHEESVRIAFTALSQTLTDFSLEAWGDDATIAANAILQHVHLLTRLENLELDYLESPRTLDLSGLARLPNLQSFSYGVEGNAAKVRFTPEQVADLARCPALLALEHACWSPPQAGEAPAADEWVDQTPAAQLVDQGIGALVRGQLSRPAGPTLQRLSLGGTAMSAAVWEHVSRLTTLQALEPASWRADLAAGCGGGAGGGEAAASSPQWERLANFSQLQRFDLRPYRHEGLTSRTPLRSEMFLPPLLRGCVGLLSLGLGPDLDLSASQMTAIATGLPHLSTLCLRGVALGDVHALAGAAHLTALMLEYCSGPRAAPAIQMRRVLPPLPRLASLVLLDRCRITEQEAEPLNQEMLARMPSLSGARLTQNLLSPSVTGQSWFRRYCQPALQ